MKLKSWQKWGIGFGIVHILVCAFFLYYSKFDTGCPSIYVILFWLDFPISAVIGTFSYLEKLVIRSNPNEISLKYIIYNHMIFGSLIYAIVGSLIGKFVKVNSSKTKLQFLIVGIIIIVLALPHDVLFFMGGLGISLLPIGLIFLILAIFCPKKI